MRKKLYGFLAAGLVAGLLTFGLSSREAVARNWQQFRLSVANFIVGYVTMENNEKVDNATDAVIAIEFDDDAVELGDIRVSSSNESTSDNDYLRYSFYAEDDASGQVEIANIDVVFSDVTSTTTDSTMDFSVHTADSIGEVFNLGGAVQSHTFQTDAVELGDLKVVSANTATAANDYFRSSWYGYAANGTLTEVANLDVSLDDVTTATVDSTIELSVITAGTLAAELNLTGAALYPEATGGLALGTSSYQFAPSYFDGLVCTGTLALTGGLTADTVTSLAGQDEVRTMSYSFFDPDVAASQSAAAWGMDAGASVGGADFQGVVMPWAGSVIGIAAYSNDACTSGSLTADATINGTATGLQAVINTTDTQTKYASQANNTDAFTAGQRIGVKVTTTSNWLPTTADVIVTVFVEY